MERVVAREWVVLVSEYWAESIPVEEVKVRVELRNIRNFF